jgi:hypothetical protein
LIGSAKVSAATQLAGNVIQGYGQKKAMEEQRDYEFEQQQAAQDRYNQNVGTNWWGNSGAPSAPSQYAQSAPTGLVSGAMTPRQQYEDEMRALLSKYNPYAAGSGYA